MEIKWIKISNEWRGYIKSAHNILLFRIKKYNVKRFKNYPWQLLFKKNGKWEEYDCFMTIKEAKEATHYYQTTFWNERMRK